MAARKAPGEANALGDLETTGPFTAVSRGIGQGPWLVEAQLQAEG